MKEEKNITGKRNERKKKKEVHQRGLNSTSISQNTNGREIKRTEILKKKEERIHDAT